MHPFFRNLCLVFAAFLPATCSSAKTEVIGNTLTTNVKPYISITGAAPLSVQGHGRLIPDVGSATSSIKASVQFDYAIYADSESGAVGKYGYAAIVRLRDANLWRFLPQSEYSKSGGAFHLAHKGEWTEQLLRVNADSKDWSSAVWTANNREIPQVWLAKRWSQNLNETIRVVMEYREPWPDDLGEDPVNLPTAEGGAELAAFVARADKAFSAEKKAGDFKAGIPTPATKLTMPREQPDVDTLVGSVQPKSDH